MNTPTLTLTADQIAFYQREGYLRLPAITTAEEVTALCQIYDRLFATEAGRAEGDHLDLSSPDGDGQKAVLPQILNPSKYAPELAATRFRANAEVIARQLIGPEADFRGDHAIRKAAFSEAETPWHQDEAYWEPDLEYEELSIWIPLQPATLDNGCMHFIPGSQAQEVLPHHPIGNDPRVVGLEVDEAQTRAVGAVACPLPAGGATIHHSRTLHYTGPNRTAEPRRAYILAFGLPRKQRATARDFYWLAQQKTSWQERRAAAEDDR